MPLKTRGPLEATATPTQPRGSGSFPFCRQLGSAAATGASQHPLHGRGAHPRLSPCRVLGHGTREAHGRRLGAAHLCGPRALPPPPRTGQPRDGTGRAPALPYLSLLPPLPSAAGEAGRGRRAATRCPAPAPLSMAPPAGRARSAADARREPRADGSGGAPRPPLCACSRPLGHAPPPRPGTDGSGWRRRGREQPRAEPPGLQGARPHAARRAPCTAGSSLPPRGLPGMAVPPRRAAPENLWPCEELSDLLKPWMSSALQSKLMKGRHAACSVNTGLAALGIEAGSVWKEAASWNNCEGKGFKTVAYNSVEGKILSSQASVQT